MARKENIYAVDKSTNIIVRVSRSFLAACDFMATQKAGSIVLCTSVFQNLKKGDVMVEAGCIL